MPDYRLLFLSAAAVALMLAVPATAGAAELSPAVTYRVGKSGIHPWLEPRERVTADVLLDGKGVAKFDYQAATEGMRRQPAVTFTIPVNTQRLELRGKLHDPQGKPRAFRKTWKVRDIASYTAPLYDRSHTWLERVQAFAKRVDLGGVVPYPAAERSAGETSLRQLERRLKIKIPEPVFTLAHYRIGIETQFLAASKIKTVTEMLHENWSYPLDGEDGLNRLLSPAARARYDRSIAVFAEVGDGYGALAWDPAGVVANEPGLTFGDKGGAQPATPNAGVWFWLHADTLGEWDLLLDRNYRPRSAEDAMTNALQRFYLQDIDSPENKNELVIDTANPNALLQLHFERDDKLTPKLWLRSYDYHYSLY